jgi:hypothetical protein
LVGDLVDPLLDAADDLAKISVRKRPDQDHAEVLATGFGPPPADRREITAVSGDQDPLFGGGELEQALVVEPLER